MGTEVEDDDCVRSASHAVDLSTHVVERCRGDLPAAQGEAVCAEVHIDVVLHIHRHEGSRLDISMEVDALQS